MTARTSLALDFPAHLARDRAVRRYSAAYDRLATDAQILRAEGGKPITWRRAHRRAEVVLAALQKELNDPHPDDLDVTWDDAVRAIEG